MASQSIRPPSHLLFALIPLMALVALLMVLLVSFLKA